MKQLLCWIYIISKWKPDNQERKTVLRQLCGMTLAFLLTGLITQPVYSQGNVIRADGETHLVSASYTSVSDLTLPNNNQIVAISFNLTGGDGGNARIFDDPTKVDFISYGGKGANTIADFMVGPGQIPAGSTFRFVTGTSGEGDWVQRANGGNGISYGGGGGGSAVLYQEPNSPTWNLLAVAGGGGGAFQEMVDYVATGGKDGQGGQLTESGGSGNGILNPGSGGSNGAGGEGNDKFAGGGGGTTGPGGGLFCIEGCSTYRIGGGGSGGSFGAEGGRGEGPFIPISRNGGAGVGGGGVGIRAGGGGGGYSGGGAGGSKGRGGGGGSYVHDKAISKEIKAGVWIFGRITYQVILNKPPVALCESATIYLNGNGEATLEIADINNGSYDPDGTNVILSLDKTSFDCSNVGKNTVKLTVTDSHEAQDFCEVTVTIIDEIPPTALCKPITVQLDMDGKASIEANDVDNGSSDLCGIKERTVSPSSFTCADVGTSVTVTVTVTDYNDNASSCTTQVTVIDEIPPIALCKPFTVQLNELGEASITAADIDDGSTDNCEIKSVEADITDFTCADVGIIDVTLTVTDVHGNFSTCISQVTIEDNVDPVAICQNITVQLNGLGEASITAADIDGGSTDNCGNVSFEADITDFTCADVGVKDVTLTVTDINGNVSTCISQVTIEDNEDPVAICQNITIQLDASGKASIVATDIDDSSMDACGIASYETSKTNFNYEDLGNNNVVLTVTDRNGNSSRCSAIVTVEDNIKPIVRTRNVTILLDKQGKGAVTPEMVNNGSTDNNHIVSMWLEGKTDYDCGDTGEHEVVLKARDQSGNIGSYNAFITVKFYEPDFTNIYDVAKGDTLHRVNCQVPWDISRYDLDYETISKHGTLTTHLHKEDLPENAPWGMYALWRYEYVMKDACYHTYKFNYYLALYDLAPPVYQNFPRDTIVATLADVPPVDMKVKIIDVCQYVVWDTVMTMPVLNPESGDTLGFTRRWMARDPSGHKSFKDQMIWLGPSDRKQYSMITGRIADEDHIVNTKFAGEAGTNGLPISLYRLDTVAGTKTWVSSWTTGDWQGAQGTYYFVPEHPGSYQVKIDTAICLVDTLKFNKWLWSDTLTIAVGDTLDQGWIVTHECVEPDTTITDEAGVPEPLVVANDVIQSKAPSNTEWRVYPNPASGYLKIDINRDDAMNYRIYDVLGRSVKKGVYQRGQVIDVHGLNAGLYHLQLRDQKEILGTKRVLLME